MSIEYMPFTQAMIPQAGLLLAQRHQRNRLQLPEMPARFEQPQVAAKAIETLLAKKNSGGFAALRDGRLSAYLLGEATVQPWARCGYVYLPGYALAEKEDPQLLQDLYALLGEQWNRKGYFSHYAYICAADGGVKEAWFNLGFGKERVDALLDLRSANIPELESPAGVDIRRVGKQDGDLLAGLSDTIWRHQSRAPRWHPTMPDDIEKQVAGWVEIASTESDLAYLAMENGQALGSLGFFVEEELDDDMTITPHCRYMTIAATVAAARGRGIGTALAWHGLKQAREHGAEYCLTNWQSANLLAARFWPRFGFVPVAFRLARVINPAIAWAIG